MSLTFDEAAKWLMIRNNFLIINHLRPDGDAHGSAAALAQGLRECGKTAYILENPDTTDRFRQYVQEYYPVDDFAPSYIITVDTASAGMLSKAAGSLVDSIDLSIDHHPSNSGYAKELCLDGTMASCGELIYEILTRLPCGVSQKSAEAIYIAVSTDTGCFAFANTTANTFRVASEAANRGAPIAELNRRFFRTKSKGRVQLEGEILSGIGFYFGDKVAIITITRAMMDKYGVTENDMDD
ncbi:MAG: DHH family phosphoesterase, partial [Oscillospiraceae bacterium]|nr:DHH family phosphoesterase [Oscillospiraceae bacterium]